MLYFSVRINQWLFGCVSWDTLFPQFIWWPCDMTHCLHIEKVDSVWAPRRGNLVSCQRDTPEFIFPCKIQDVCHTFLRWCIVSQEVLYTNWQKSLEIFSMKVSSGICTSVRYCCQVCILSDWSWKWTNLACIYNILAAEFSTLLLIFPVQKYLHFPFS